MTEKNWRKEIDEALKDKGLDTDKSAEMNDMFDIVRETLKVNSPISTMNSDFIMSDLKPEIIQNTVQTYVREQLQIIEIINIYLGENWEKEWYKDEKTGTMTKKYKKVKIKDKDGEEREALVNEDEEYREKVNRILLNEVFSMVNLSRADKGRVINALVDYIRASAISAAQTAATEEPEKKTSALSKLNPMNWGKKKEGETG